MQTMGVVGKIYNLKDQSANGKERVMFKVSVRKEWVSDQDKQDKKTQTFVPIAANGPTAKFILDFFKDGDTICIKDMEYQTYRTKNADPNNNFDDGHIFKANKVGFVPGANQDGDQGQGQSRGNNNNNQRQQSNNRQPAGQSAGGRGRDNRQAPPPQDNYNDNYTPANDDLPF